MKKTLLISLIFIFLGIGTAYAQLAIKAEVDKTNITTDETFTYKLTVVSTLKKVPQPQLPDFAGFRVISQAQSSSFSLGKKSFEIKLEYVYILEPIGRGKFTIGPSSIKFKDDTYSTDSFEIEVTQGKSQPKKEPGIVPPLPQEPVIPESEQPKITL